MTGKPADYVFILGDQRMPRWHRQKKFSRVVDELMKRPDMVFMGVTEAAELLGLSGQTIRNHIQSGHLPASRPTRNYMLKGSDVIAFAQRQRGIAPPVNLVAAL